MTRVDYVPQLATLVEEPPNGDDWWHELKYDGYRIGCDIRGSRATLISRNGRDWTSAFPTVAEAARGLGIEDALLDGEVAAVLPEGRTSFQALQNAARGAQAGVSLVYYVFDLLRLDGSPLGTLTLAERKARLEALLPREHPCIKRSMHVVGGGRAFFAEACRLGLEGIVSKRPDRPYCPGRSRDWLKAKCTRRQEFVIGGFTDPEGTRAGLGALLVGYYEDGRLVFAGKVGTGFTHAFVVELRKRLGRLEQATCPFTPPPPRAIARRAHWVRPELVCEVTFTEWTDEGMIRHPSFEGLRTDKSPQDVHRERGVARDPIPRRARRIAALVSGTPPPQPAPESKAPAVGHGGASAPSAARAANRASDDTDIVAGVRITHGDRVFYPDLGLTKRDLARYYEAVAEWIVPHVAGRPLTVLRCPKGLAGPCTFMKHSKVWGPDALRIVRIREKTKVGEYLVADDIAGIVALVQMDILELHTWNSTAADLERPNRLVLDLDPGGDVPWPRVAAAARMVRKVLAALDLDSWCKTTGGRGLHVVVPLVPEATWQTCLRFARTLAETLERTEPETFTSRFARNGREQRILVDYLRNNRTNTSIAAFSSRARAGAPVSMPVAWDELRPSLAPHAFTVQHVPGRLGRLKSDPWKGYWTARQKLTAARLQALELAARRS